VGGGKKDKIVIFSVLVIPHALGLDGGGGGKERPTVDVGCVSASTGVI